MNRIRSKSIAKLAAASSVFFAAASALAIGPSYQYIPDAVPAAISTYNDMVSLTNAGGFVGSGAVIGQTIIPINPTQSEAMLTILTANHVAVENITTANFGAGPNAYTAAGVQQAYVFSGPVNPTFQTYTLFDTTNNPNNLPEDVSIMQGTILFNNNAKPAALTTILNNAANIATAFAGAVGAQSVGFTNSGYGQGGVWNGTNALAGNAYNGNSIYEARRFQNNTSTQLQAPFIQTYGAYYEPIVNDRVQAPSVPGATGAGFDGDSGSPWLTGGNNGTVTDSPQNPNDYNKTVTPAVAPVYEPNGTTVGNNTVLNVNFSNNESAVFVAGSFITGKNAIAQNSIQSAVPLLTLAQQQAINVDDESTQGNYDWAKGYANNPVSIPEPGTFSVLALGGFALMRRRIRRTSGTK